VIVFEGRWDETATYRPATGVTLVEAETLPAEVGVGWRKVGGSWKQPSPISEAAS